MRHDRVDGGHARGNEEKERGGLEVRVGDGRVGAKDEDGATGILQRAQDIARTLGAVRECLVCNGGTCKGDLGGNKVRDDTEAGVFRCIVGIDDEGASNKHVVGWIDLI
jgi:hypothetical protein